MPNRALRALLFLSSYSPVFGIFAIRYFDRDCALFYSSLALMVIGVVGIAALFTVVSQHEPENVYLGEVESRDPDLAGYLVGYLLPLVSVEAQGWREAAGLVLFFAIIGIVYVNSRMIYINPLLSLAGFHLLKAEETTSPGTIARTRKAFLITREDWVAQGDQVRCRRVMKDALIVLPKDQSRGR